MAGGIAIVAAVALAGCGSSDKSSSETTATTDWANSLCSAVTTYKTSLQTAGSSLKNSPTKATLQDAANNAQDATNTLVDSIKGLGKPGTSAGAQAKDTLDTLADQLKTDADTVKSASGGSDGVVSAISVASTALVTAKGQVQQAVAHLQELDAKGELSDAFSQASSCSPYVNG